MKLFWALAALVIYSVNIVQASIECQGNRVLYNHPLPSRDSFVSYGKIALWNEETIIIARGNRCRFIDDQTEPQLANKIWSAVTSLDFRLNELTTELLNYEIDKREKVYIMTRFFLTAAYHLETLIAEAEFEPQPRRSSV